MFVKQMDETDPKISNKEEANTVPREMVKNQGDIIKNMGKKLATWKIGAASWVPRKRREQFIELLALMEALQWPM